MEIIKDITRWLKLYQEDGLVIKCGNKYWYKDGKFHHEDGPAVECVNGKKCWYKNDKFLSTIEGENTV
jgi:hypothetical protein